MFKGIYSFYGLEKKILSTFLWYMFSLRFGPTPLYMNNMCYGQTPLYIATWFFQTAIYSGAVRQTRS